MYRLLVFLVAAVMLSGQRHQVNINAETPEGQLLQSIGQTTDSGRKMALMEEFLQKYSSNANAAWVLDQVIAQDLKDNQFDKALAAADKLLAIDPDDTAAAHSALQAAVAKKDPALIQKWSVTTSKLARKALAAPKPTDETAAENWTAMVDYAKQVDVFTEYSLYAAALTATDPAQKIALRDALESQSPQSQYLPQLDGAYFLALRQAGQNDKALALAEKILQKDQSNEDMLLVVADNYLTKKTRPEKVIEYSTKLAQVMEARQKPDGVSDADWNKRRTLMMGLGYWMAGVTQAGQNNFVEADAMLRKALPLVEGNDALKGQALFYLGMSNYKMGEPKKDKRLIAEALKFNAMCAAIKGPFQGQAAKNATVIRQQYGMK